MKQFLFIQSFLFCLFSSTFLQAQGVLDTSFASTGIKLINNSTYEYFNTVLIQPDGQILLAGTSGTSASACQFIITRLNQDGSFDPSFNSGTPRVFANSTNTINEIKAIALQDDGKILITGNTGFSISTSQICFRRLMPDGSDDVSFSNAIPYGSMATGNSIFFDNTTKKILVTGNSSNSLVVCRLNPDGSLDGTFATGGVYSYSNATGSSVIGMPDGSVIVGGTYMITNQFFLAIKLKIDGTLDVNFNGSGVNNSIQFLSPVNCNATSMLILPDGRIQLGGWTNTSTFSKDFAFARLLPTGTYDPSFGNTTTPGRITYDNAGNSDAINSMVLQSDGNNIVASGNSGSAYAAIRIDSVGQKDNTFGTNGIFFLSSLQGSCNGSDIDIVTSTAVLAGSSGSSTGLMAVRIKLYQPQKINILGKQVVSIETENTYYIDPVITGYKYVWTYSNNYVYVLGANTKDSVTLYFKRTTPSGVLTCKVLNNIGEIVYVATIPVQVNPEPTLAELLEKPKCVLAQSICNAIYINSFQLKKPHNIQSNGLGCSSSGYNDLTAITDYDTLYKGDDYRAIIKCVGVAPGHTTYCGIWIDLDNNGVINPSREFAGSGLSTDATLYVNNMFIPNDADIGPKRLRVRISTTAPFKATDFCIVNNDIGETEDYLFLLLQHEDFKAPNFITPNNDGKNDYFIIHGIKSEQKNELKVYNKSGDLVYETDHYDNLWGGRDKGNELLTKGTYYYVFIKDSGSNDLKNVERGFFEIRY